MKRAIIVHCWSGTPNYCWYPKTKKELEQRSFTVSIPEMPETDLPKLSLWLPMLQQIAANPDEELFLIGHSAGCITILRYLEQLKYTEKVGGVVFVAGFTDDLDTEELKNFFTTPIDFAKIKTKTKNIVAIQSDNDSFVDLKYADIMKEKLGAQIIIKHNFDHFSGAIGEAESCTSLPDVTEKVIEMSKL